ncbi:MAG TPA: hypothetical protein VGI81_08940 [Tepidisphaeraceae bacterium]|jgi:hypothetical protein
MIALRSETWLGLLTRKLSRLAWLLLALTLFAPLRDRPWLPIPPWWLGCTPVWQVFVEGPLGWHLSPPSPQTYTLLVLPFLLAVLPWMAHPGRAPWVVRRILSFGLLSAWVFPYCCLFVFDDGTMDSAGLMRVIWAYDCLAASATLLFASLQLAPTHVGVEAPPPGGFPVGHRGAEKMYSL